MTNVDIVATVELYVGSLRTIIELPITEDDLNWLAEKKAMDEYQCDSSATKKVSITTKID